MPSAEICACVRPGSSTLVADASVWVAPTVGVVPLTVPEVDIGIHGEVPSTCSCHVTTNFVPSADSAMSALVASLPLVDTTTGVPHVAAFPLTVAALTST